MLLGLIGAGIGRSLAPALHEEEGRRQGLQLEYRLIDLDREGGPGALAALVRGLVSKGFTGVNVTYPCKQSVMPLLDALTPQARAIGAVNTVVAGRDGKLTGHNTDGPGWSWGLRRALPEANLARVALLGAGGAGAACAHAVLELGAKEVLIADQDAARAVSLAARLNEHLAGGRARAVDLGAILEGATGFIHATPTGTEGRPGMPLQADVLRASMWVSEVVHRPLETELTKAARAAGCAVVDGGHMNVGQAVGAFRLFTGLAPDASRMEAHFRRLAA